MNHSILIADDSLTIQKVIRITLSSESYDLSDCDSSKKLFELAESAKPSLVLLDFTIDEGVSGYDICKKIQKISPETKIMIMYGTFDSVDDELFHACGASGKIIKPFDGQKFITMCHQILEDEEFYGVTSDESPLAAINEELSEDMPEPIIDEAFEESPIEDTEEFIEALADDEWSLDDEDIELAPETQDILNKPESDEIDSDYSFQSMISDELNDWGMSVPPMISEDIKTKETKSPELIDEVKEKVSEIAAIADLAPDSIHDEDDEEVEDFDFSNLVESEPVKLEIVPSEDEDEDEDDLETVSVNPEGELEAKELIDFDLNNNEDKFSALESQLMGDIDDVDDLWKVDEPAVIDSISEKAQEELVASVKENAEITEVPVTDIEESDIKKYVHEYMAKHGKAIIEKVAWEMIPDMAENIIREEVKSMAEKVLSKD